MALRCNLCLIAALIFAGLFIYAGIQKIIEPHAFARAIKNYKILPLSSVNLVALVLPWLEIFSGLSLLLPYTRRAGAMILCLLSCVFFIAVTSALMRGLDIECGCFASSSSKAGLPHLAFNFILALGSALIAYRSDASKKSL